MSPEIGRPRVDVVGIGDDVLIGGIIINGIPAKKLVVRAIGPSLATAPFSLSEKGWG